MRTGEKTTQPLNPATLLILLALAGADLHGYAIMQEVSRQSDGKYRLGPGTLYDNLQRLIDLEWVKELDSNDPRRRYYRLTPSGRKILSAEIDRLERVVWDGRLRLGKPRRA
jgi:DNA-binding PadR family transcriptional regulator